MKIFNLFKKTTKNSNLANIEPLSEAKLENMINGIDVSTTTDGADKTTKGTGKSASGATNSGS